MRHGLGTSSTGFSAQQRAAALHAFATHDPLAEARTTYVLHARASRRAVVRSVRIHAIKLPHAAPAPRAAIAQLRSLSIAAAHRRPPRQGRGQLCAGKEVPRLNAGVCERVDCGM